MQCSAASILSHLAAPWMVTRSVACLLSVTPHYSTWRSCKSPGGTSSASRGLIDSSAAEEGLRAAVFPDARSSWTGGFSRPDLEYINLHILVPAVTGSLCWEITCLYLRPPTADDWGGDDQEGAARTTTVWVRKEIRSQSKFHAKKKQFSTCRSPLLPLAAPEAAATLEFYVILEKRNLTQSY